MSANEQSAVGPFLQAALTQLNSIKNIQFSIPFLSFQSRNKKWNAQIKQMTEHYENAIKVAQSPRDIFFAMATLEKESSKIINHVLNQIDKNKKLSDISQSLDTLNALNQTIKDINLTMSEHVDAVIQDGLLHDSNNPLWQKLADLSEKIVVNTDAIKPLLEGNQAGIANLDQIVARGGKLVLTTLIKAMNTEPGRQLINQLHASLQDGKQIIVQPSFTTKQTGMGVSPVGAEGPFALVNDDLGSNTSLESRIESGVTPSSGGSSALDVPITMPEEAYEDLGEYMSQPDIVNKSFSNLVGGDFYFDNNQITYIPFQVEMLHELIHVQHNADGVNHRHVPLNEEEEALWHTYEEFTTIKGGEICEADFAPIYGAPLRENHSGKETSVLFDPNERDPKITLHDLIQKNTPRPHNHHHSHANFDRFKGRYNEIINEEQKNQLNPDEKVSNETRNRMS